MAKKVPPRPRKEPPEGGPRDRARAFLRTRNAALRPREPDPQEAEPEEDAGKPAEEKPKP